MSRQTSRLSLGICVVAGLLSGCDSDASSGANLGVAGASCLRTPDCAAPLQCISNVCTDVGGAGDVVADTLGGDAGASDVGGGGVSDVAAGTSDSSGGLVPDILTEYDATGFDFIDGQGGTSDIAVATDTFFDDCGALGIEDEWVGPFNGDINFMLSANNLGVPTTGVLPVTGVLGFDITCIESKFVVDGTLDGTATVPGQGGAFPFKMRLRGLYNPSTKQLTAQMIDGSVTIFAVIEVYFAGTFVGQALPNDTMAGTWMGASTGTNQTAITGTADGSGTWSANGN